jgi:hypothetical protein
MHTPAALILMYFVLPLWLVAGFADWLCHRTSHIELTTGPKESLIHLLMFGEAGIALMAGIFLQINALVIALMILVFFVHEATALWDVSYAVTLRRVGPIEQHVHSFLELIPLLAIICVITLHWTQFLALFGAGTEVAQYTIRSKDELLPVPYLASLFGAIVLFEILPYLEELLRGWRQARKGAIHPGR